MKAPPSLSMHVLKVTLLEVEPAVWRRIRVPSEIGLDELHLVLQAVMGWTNSHLHQFQVGSVSYGTGDEDWPEPRMRDESSVSLVDVAPRRGAKLLYEYDFGDGWMHLLQVERVEPHVEGVAFLACLDGARACPPEDVGGPPGYEEFLAVLGDPEHEEHEERLEWVGGAFDPEAFEVEAVNAVLRQMQR